MQTKTSIIPRILIGLLLSAPPSLSQAGSVGGKVIGANGRPLVGADVSLQRLEDQRNYKVKTNRDGDFFHAGLPVGTYKVYLEMAPQMHSRETSVGSGNPTIVIFDLRETAPSDNVGTPATTPGQADKRKVYAAPKIIVFTTNPALVRPGRKFRLSWEVKGATKLTLYAGGREVESRMSGGWPMSMPGAFSTTAGDSEKWTLVAENRAGDKDSMSRTVGVPRYTQGVCKVTGQLAGNWRPKIQERPNSQPYEVIVTVNVLDAQSRELVGTTEVNKRTGRYFSKNLRAGRRYIVAPTWVSVPTERPVDCGAAKSHESQNFRVTGGPLID